MAVDGKPRKPGKLKEKSNGGKSKHRDVTWDDADDQAGPSGRPFEAPHDTQRTSSKADKQFQGKENNQEANVGADEASGSEEEQTKEPTTEELQTASADEGPDSGDGEQNGHNKKKKVLSAKKLQKLKEAYNRRGVIYVSRIPPHMKPMKLKQLLSQYGDINRIYCALEDPSLRRKRKQKGGNSGKNYTEGWVEFEDKRVAKRVALMLNGQKIGGKRRSAYYDDLWCLKYLKKFKWDHLTEEIAYQKAVREQKLAAEISAAKRERDFYLSRVDKAKAMNAIKERKHKRQEENGAAGSAGQAKAPSDGDAGQGGQGGGKPRFVRHYGQRKAKADPVSDAHAPELSPDVLFMVARKKQRVE